MWLASKQDYFDQLLWPRLTIFFFFFFFVEGRGGQQGRGQGELLESDQRESEGGVRLV